MAEVGGLRMWILHVIGEFGPSNGVEIMANVQKHYDLQVQWQRKGTHIHPHHEGSVQSKRLLPGSVYPMLKKMTSEGLITKQDDGKYDLTKEGKIIVTNLFEHFQQSNELDQGVLSVGNSLKAMNWHASYMEELDKEEIAPHEEAIELLIERLKKIKESLK